VVKSPDRGDFVWLDFNPQAGREQAGSRPGLVLSPGAYNGPTGLCLVVPVTSRKKGYPFEVQIPPNAPVKGVVLSDQVRCVDWKARNARIKGRAPKGVVDEVLAKMNTLLA